MKKLRIISTVLALFLVSSTAVYAQILPGYNGIVYVKKGATGNGSSWANATPELADALQAAQTNTNIQQIWVAAGTYKPLYMAGNGNSDRDKAFVLPLNVKVYGGFAGTEDAVNKRVFPALKDRKAGYANETILSGDIGVEGNTSDNAYHVVIAVSNMETSTLDGFTITGGNGNGSGNIVIRTINVSRNNGSAIYVANMGNNDMAIANNLITGNIGSENGALYNTTGNLKVSASVFEKNSAKNGGGICNSYSGKLAVFGSMFGSNSATERGGAIQVSGELTLANSVLYSNTAEYGGAIEFYGHGTIVNNTFVGNTSTAGGGAIYTRSGTIAINNSILWNNKNNGVLNDIQHQATLALTINNSLYHTAIGDNISSNNVITGADPMFVDAEQADFGIQPWSLAIDKGHTDLYLLDYGGTDVAGNNRIHLDGIDMGAYESKTKIQPDVNKRLHVKQGATGNGSGNSWANAIPELADALMYAETPILGEVTEIWVAAGTYKPLYKAGNGTTNRDKAFVMVKNVAVYGGFTGTETTLEQRTLPLLGGGGGSILSGDIGIANNATDNAYHVVIAIGDMGTATLNGFTITGGNANDGSNITLAGVSVLRANGSGVYIANTTNQMALANNTITNNKSGASGTLYNAGILKVSASVFENNSATAGGGIFNEDTGRLDVFDSKFSNNSAAGYGGAIHSSGLFTLVNSALYNNTAKYGGAADFYGDATLINNTIANNSSTDKGGAILIRMYTVTINNSILWGNKLNNDPHDVQQEDGTVTISYSLYHTATGTVSSNNSIVKADPLFVDATGADFNLKQLSPAINRGLGSYYSNAYSNKDLAGNNRVQLGTIDMGAYEATKGIDISKSRLFVKPGATGDGSGSSWANAIPDLADAFLYASTVAHNTIAEIWVAAGTYKPKYKAAEKYKDGNPTTDRDKAFVLPANIAVYGGFPADANDTEHRTIFTRTLPTSESGGGSILSGSIGGEGNAYHVVIAAGDAGIYSLDGFIITGGSTMSNIYDLSITVNGVSVPAIYAGGIYARTDGLARVDLRNNRITGNASTYRGGGVYAYNNVNLTNNVITANYAAFDGGGVSTEGSAVTIANNRIFANTAGSRGGGLFANAVANATHTATNNSVYANRAANGGGIYVYSTNATATVTLTNNSVSGNTANSDGGGIYVYAGNGIVTLINNSVSANTASANGGGIFANAGTSINIYNSIVWGNGPTDMYRHTIGGGSISVGNSLIGSTGWSFGDYNLDKGGNLIDINPMFVNAAGGNLSLQPFSPAINAGNNSYYSITDYGSKDLAGNSRIQQNAIDMGAYESAEKIQIDNRLYVKPEANGTGSSWDDAMPELSDALDYAATSSGAIKEIWVAAGTYYPLYKAGNGTSDRDRAFVLPPNVKVYGGFTGTEAMLEERALPLQGSGGVSILSGDIGIANDASDNAYHVVIATGDMGSATLNGFTITGGNANGSGNITLEASDIPRLNGSGVYLAGTAGEMLLANNTITANLGDGSGTLHSAGKLRVLASVFENNSSAYGGAIFSASGSSLSVFGSRFSGNSATEYGGAIHSTGIFTMVNSVLYNNTAKYGGAADFYNNAILVNNTFANNSVTNQGGGILVRAGTVTISNSILWDNMLNGTSNDIQHEGGSIAINHSLYNTATGTVTGGNNLTNVNPMFANVAGGSYGLLSWSLAINAGNNSYYNTAAYGDTDLAGNPRIQLTTIDMGAYESATQEPLSERLYVKQGAAATGTGSSWANAIPELADALVYATAAPGLVKEIWVAAGTYYPLYKAAEKYTDNAATTDRDRAFVLPPNVKVYGGFAGTETELSQRILPPNGGAGGATILSGDLGKNDNPNDLTANRSDNAYHVVIAAGTTGSFLLDGFTVTGGSMSEGNNTISVNSMTINIQCGGGIYAYAGGTAAVILANNSVYGNTTKSDGGGIYVLAFDAPTITLTNNSVYSNTAKIDGGGICVLAFDAPTITLTNNSVHGNVANDGGGIFAYAEDNATTTLINNNVYGNTANGNYGGGIICVTTTDNATVTLTNNSVHGNTASNRGGGIHTQVTGTVTLTNNSVYGNTANSGGGIYAYVNAANGTINIYNSIVWGNSSTNVNSSILNNGKVNIANSLIGDSSLPHDVTDGGGNLYATNPMFVDAPNGKLNLLPWSPAINAGNNSYYSTTAYGDTDLAGNPRIQLGTIDMGAYESAAQEPLSERLYVKQGAAGTGTGSSWADALPELADALMYAAAAPGLVKEIWVAAGTYYPLYKAAEKYIDNTPTTDRDRAFVLPPNVKVYGGFAGTETELSQRILPPNGGAGGATILSGDLGKNDNPNDLTANRSDNAYHVVIAAGTTGSYLFDGFTVTGGSMSEGNNAINVNSMVIHIQCGGGIYAYAGGTAAVILANNSVYGNTTKSDGGGIYVLAFDAPTITLTNNSVYSNTAKIGGGGICVLAFDAPTITLTNNSVHGNVANDGGGIFAYAEDNATTTLINNNVYGNMAGDRGGGIICVTTTDNATVTLTNNSVHGNTASNSGGGIYTQVTGTVTLTNNSVYGNTANSGGGIYAYVNAANGTINIYNSIVWGNSSTNVNSSILNNGKVNIANSLIGESSLPHDVTDGGGNLTATNPMFVDAPNGKLNLLPWSPAINAGNNSYYSTTAYGDTDLAGNPRIQLGTIDMGAYESATQEPFSERLYVKQGAAGTGTGSSWANALPELADALKYAAAAPGLVKEIWVAAGTYYPLYKAAEKYNDNTATTDRDRAFVLPPNVKVYGGFAGTETELSQRILPPNGGATILSGDFNNDDNPNDLTTNRSDNAYHVVIAAGNTGSYLFDGFSVTGGNASVNDKSVSIYGVRAYTHYAGGIYACAEGTVAVTLTNNSVYGNTASYGGGIYANANATLMLSNNSVHNNNCTVNGGGILVTTGALTFAAATSITSATVTNNRVYGNTANNDGGGIYATSYAFAAIATATAITTIVNNNVYDNTANRYGGGVYSEAYTLSNSTATTAAMVTLTNNSMYGNRSSSGGGGIYAATFTNTANATINIYNSILWGNMRGEAVSNLYAKKDNGNETINLANSLIGESSLPADATDGGGNLYATNPMFVDAPNGKLSLQPTSPAIDAGSNALYTAAGGNIDTDTDLAGNPRVRGTAIDMGAYEAKTNPTVTWPTTATLSYGQSLDEAVLAGHSGDGTFAFSNGAIKPTVANSGVTGYTLVFTPANTDDYSILEKTDMKVTVNKVLLTVTARPLSYVYGTNPATYNAGNAYDIAGFVSGDNSAVLSEQPKVRIAPSITATTSVGTYSNSVEVYGATAANYSFGYISNTLTITQASTGNITFDAIPAKIYGDAPFNLSGRHVLGKELIYESDNPIVTVHNTGQRWEAVINGAGTVTLTAKFKGDSDVQGESVDQTITIAKAPLTVTARQQERMFGEANPDVSLAYDYSGFINATDEGLFVTIPQAAIDPQYNNNTPEGTYPKGVLVSGGEHPYYNLSYVAGRLTIIAAIGDIFFTSVGSKLYGDANFNLTATHVGGNTVLFESLNTDIISLHDEGGIVKAHILKAGTAQLRAYTLAGNNYQASEAFQTVDVEKATLTIRPYDKERAYKEANPSFTLEYSGFKYNDDESTLSTITVTTNATINSPVGIYDIEASGAANTSYNILYNKGVLTVSRAVPVLTDLSYDLTAQHYDGSPKNITVEPAAGITGLGAITIKYDGSTTPPTAIGTYIVAVDIAEGVNYNSVTGLVLGSFEIAKTDINVGNSLHDAVTNRYVLSCSASTATVTVSHANPNIKVYYNGVEGFIFTVSLPTAGEHIVSYTVVDGQGGSHSYSLTIVKPFAFADVVQKRWDNTLTVINNPANNRGYTFTSYKWYYNGMQVGTDQSYSAGSDGRTLPAGEYYVVLTANELTGEVSTCPETVTQSAVRSNIVVYPNPVRRGNPVTVKSDLTREAGAVVELFNLSGIKVGSQPVSGESATVIAPTNAGTYILRITAVGQVETFKLIVE